MPFCPKCREEYREGFTVCPECGSELVPALPPQNQEPSLTGRLVVASIVYDEITASILESKLQSAGIPYLRQYQAGGEVMRLYMGASFFGIELLVPEEMLDLASAILAPGPVPDLEQQALDAETTPEEEEKKGNGNGT